MIKNKFTLSFIDTVLHFMVEDDSLQIMEKVLDFFKSHFDTGPGLYKHPDVMFYIRSYTNFTREPYGERSFKPLTIRESSAKEFNLYGDKSVDFKREVVDCPKTGTAFIMSKSKKEVELYISEHSEIQLIEFIRDLIIKLEESKGTLILHAAGVVNGGVAMALVGSKGAGKSTLLLNLVEKLGFDFLSGDKLFLKIKEDQILAYGWPDYPHLGFGTIISHPKLVNAVKEYGIKIDYKNLQKKVLLPASLLQKAVGFSCVKRPVPLRHILFPSIKSLTESSITTLTDIDPAEVLKHLEFSYENQFTGWHNFITSVSRAELGCMLEQFTNLIRKCNFFEIKGTGTISLNMEGLQ